MKHVHKKVVFPMLKSGVFLTLTSNSFEVSVCLFNKRFGFWACMPFVSFTLFKKEFVFCLGRF